MSIRILHGDCRAILPTLASESVNCIVTSPPYWGLRSYLPAGHVDKHLEIGSEPTVDAWVDVMVAVFRECRRVLRNDGTLFLNLGDSYATGAGKVGACPGGGSDGERARQAAPHTPLNRMPMPGLKPKDLIGQPWMVAFALRADGWWLRQEIIWSKPNPMPESIRDRCTKAHEHVFLLSKSERYFYDFEAMQEAVNGGAHARRGYKTPDGWDTGDGAHGSIHRAGREKGKYGPLTGSDSDGAHRTKAGLNKPAHDSAEARKARANPDAKSAPGEQVNGMRPGTGVGFGHGTDAEQRARGRVKDNASFDEAMAVMPDTRNPRSVWTIPTHPFKGAHFATFPPELAKRCITAGCPPGGTVLDPFGGSGTVGLVADRMQRNAILIDLDERNVPMATERIHGEAPLFAEVAA